MKKRASIRDVAKAAGVSIATVSYVLKGIGKVSEPTIKRVWDVVNELNYTPNPYFQKLIRKEPAERERTRLLMRVSYWPSLAPVHDQVERELLFQFDKACRAKNYLGTSYVYRHEKGFQCSQVVNGLIDGALLCTSQLDVIESLKGRIPTVLVNVEASEKELGLPIVVPDYVAAYDELIKEIHLHGICGKASMIRGRVSNYRKNGRFAENKIDFFRIAAEKYGYPVLPEHSIEFETSSDEPGENDVAFIERIKNMIRKEGVRILVLNSLNFTLLYQNLLKAGLRFPEDAILIPGLIADYSAPGVISAVPDYAKLFEKSVEVLDSYLNGTESEIRKFFVPLKSIDYSGIFNLKNERR